VPSHTALVEDRNKRQSRKRRAEPHLVVRPHAARTDHYGVRHEIDGVPVSEGDYCAGGVIDWNRRCNPLGGQPGSVLSGCTLEG